MNLSIIIVNYNTKNITSDAIASIYQSDKIDSYEIIVVDNASDDGSVAFLRERFPDIMLIANDDNYGFATANNQAIGCASGRYVLLLNSDTIIREDTLSVMLDYMEEHPTVGASGCRVVMKNGTLDKACKRGFPTPAASFFICLA